MKLIMYSDSTRVNCCGHRRLERLPYNYGMRPGSRLEPNSSSVLKKRAGSARRCAGLAEHVPSHVFTRRHKAPPMSSSRHLSAQGASTSHLLISLTSITALRYNSDCAPVCHRSWSLGLEWQLTIKEMTYSTANTVSCACGGFTTTVVRAPTCRLRVSCAES